MRLLARTRQVFATIALVCIASPAFAFQAGADRVQGRVVDGSGGVIPGVTVSARSADGRMLATAITDGTGDYVFEMLPPGQLTLVFELTGFDSSTATIDHHAGAGLVVPVQRLGLASLSDSVLVVGKVPVMQAAPPLPPIARATIVQVPEHDQESVCGPAKASGKPQPFGTIVGRRYGQDRALYAGGDELTIQGGTANGLAVGQNLAVRRTYRPIGTAALGEHTSGLLQIVSVDERFAVGVVVYACDEMMPGDFLAAVTPEPVREPDAAGSPVFEQAARILFADAGQMLGVPRRLMVIDRGSERGIRAGQRLTLFHHERGLKPAIVGDAIVVAVRPDSATIRVERVIDAIQTGDYAAPQRELSARQ